MDPLIGRVTRCSTRGFVGALRLPEPDIPTFGGYCLAEAQQGESQVVGLIYDISVPDDEFARQIASSETATAEQIADHQQNRQIPVEFSALAIGYQQQGHFYSGLPPQPPLPLAPIRPMASEDLVKFTDHLDFIQVVLNASQLPTNELLVAALSNAAAARPVDQRRSFLVRAGRQSAQLLGHDLVRLESLLSSLRPTEPQ